MGQKEKGSPSGEPFIKLLSNIGIEIIFNILEYWLK